MFKRKSTYLGLILIGLIGFVGCETSNDVPDTVQSVADKYISLQQYSKEQNSTDFKISFILSKEKGIESKLSNFKIDVKGCSLDSNSIIYTPSPLVMGKDTTQGVISVIGKFAQSCTPTDYILSYTNTVSVNGKSKTVSGTISTGDSGSGSGGSAEGLLAPGYHLVNATTPVVVTYPEQNATISVQLVKDGLIVLPIRPCTESNGSTTVVTDCVVPEPIPKEYGRIDLVVWPQQDEGDEDPTNGINDNGYIRFPYVGPSYTDMPKEDKDYSFKIYYIDKNGNKAAQTTITLQIRPMQARNSSADKGVTAVSISYSGTTCTDSGGVAHYVAHAIDKYGNPVSDVLLHPSLINGVKVIKSRVKAGTLNSGSPATFSDGSVDFVTSNVTNEDRLIVLPNAENFDQSYLGNWTISEVAANSLILKESYTKSTVSNLSYIVGNEKRYLPGHGVAVAHIPDNIYKTNYKGEVSFDVVFDRALAGHTYTLALDRVIQENGITKRVGASQVESFRWNNFSSSTESVVADGNDHNVTLTLSIADCNGQPVEFLSGVRVVKESIVSDSQDCSVKDSTNNDNLVTDGNGQITVEISTKDTNSTCSISWQTGGNNLYLEY